MIDEIRSTASLFLRQKKPCGCRYPDGHFATGEIPNAHVVDDRAEEQEVTGTDMTERVVVKEYECEECGETFDVDTGHVVSKYDPEEGGRWDRDKV